MALVPHTLASPSLHVALVCRLSSHPSPWPLHCGGPGFPVTVTKSKAKFPFLLPRPQTTVSCEQPRLNLRVTHSPEQTVKLLWGLRGCLSPRTQRYGCLCRQVVAGSFLTRVFCDIFTLYLGPEHQAMESLPGRSPADRPCLSVVFYLCPAHTDRSTSEHGSVAGHLQHSGWRGLPDSYL